jgi:siroheme synthase
MVKGRVYFIGGGPGDPGLVTLRAMEVLKAAQVVIYDKGLEALLESSNKDAHRIPAQSLGKGEAVGKALAEYAHRYQVVARLKLGDPLIYSRFLEEAGYLEKLGIEYNVIPGVSSITAALGKLREPLTVSGKPVLLMSGHVINEELCGSLSRFDVLILMPTDPCGIVRLCCLEDRLITVLERLTTPEERIYVVKGSQLCGTELGKPAILLLRTDKAYPLR